jgi:hypothetical protein
VAVEKLARGDWSGVYSQLQGEFHAGIERFSATNFLVATLGTNRFCLLYVRNRSRVDVGLVPSVRLGGVSLYGFLLPTSCPNAKG